MPVIVDQFKDVLKSSTGKRLIVGSAAAIALILSLSSIKEEPPRLNPTFNTYLPQLKMQGGDPYIRALMRTISASEANDRRPYTILYGGQHVSDLSRHPEQCITIISGPNKGNCSTAAGRYQMLNTTWQEKAQRYHPQPPGFRFWASYSFEPEFQDAVVYAWLSDSQAWGTDISKLLRQGKFQQVQKLLSRTWTSIGYGIEDNSITKRLPAIYRQMLQEELQATG